ncbi:hypothetical protein BH23CHL8_BH23CHL8_30360 [soil metagenome]
MDNPKLTPCRTCEAHVAKDARACPYCGTRLPGVEAGGTITGVAAVLLLVAVGFLVYSLLQLTSL